MFSASEIFTYIVSPAAALTSILIAVIWKMNQARDVAQEAALATKASQADLNKLSSSVGEALDKLEARNDRQIDLITETLRTQITSSETSISRQIALLAESIRKVA
jgi:hypothetical protein